MPDGKPPPLAPRRRKKPRETGEQKVRRAAADALRWVRYIGAGFALLGVLGFVVAGVNAKLLDDAWGPDVTGIGLGAGLGFLLLGGTIFAIGHTFRLD
jgi:hypothetical protein